MNNSVRMNSISSRFSRNSEASASKFLENLKEMLPRESMMMSVTISNYQQHLTVLLLLKGLTKQKYSKRKERLSHLKQLRGSLMM